MKSEVNNTISYYINGTVTNKRVINIWLNLSFMMLLEASSTVESVCIFYWHFKILKQIQDLVLQMCVEMSD